MSDSDAEEMGSLLPAAPASDDPEDPDSQSVAIDIHPTADRDEAAGQIAALLAAHAAETKRLEDRVAALLETAAEGKRTAKSEFQPSSCTDSDGD